METILKYTGLAGITLCILFLTFKSIIKKNIFPTLNQRQGYNILRLVIFSILIISIICFAIYYNQNKESTLNRKADAPDTSIEIDGNNNNSINGNNNTVVVGRNDSLTKKNFKSLDSLNH